MSNFLKALKRAFRDRTVEGLWTCLRDMCDRLRAIGIDAQMVELKPGVPSSIRIRGGFIQWIRIQQVQEGDSGVRYRNNYVVPDSRRSEKPCPFTIFPVRIQTIPFFGRVVDLRWEVVGLRRKDSDWATAIVDQLQGDMLIRQTMIKSGYIEIRAGNGEWTITGFSYPSKEEWNCYQAIARHLLAVEV